jgi:hypothetical protein
MVEKIRGKKIEEDKKREMSKGNKRRRGRMKLRKNEIKEEDEKREESTPDTHCTRGRVGPRTGLDTETKGKILLLLLGIEPQSPGRTTHSQTLY